MVCIAGNRKNLNRKDEAAGRLQDNIDGAISQELTQVQHV
jgi:hypothetical protein